MTKIKVFGDSMLVVSDLRRDDIKFLASFSPGDLSLRDDAGNAYFAIGIGDPGTGYLNRFGVVYDGVSRDGIGRATLSMPLPGDSLLQENPEVVKDEIMDSYAGVLGLLKELETAVLDVLPARKVAFSNTRSMIDVG